MQILVAILFDWWEHSIYTISIIKIIIITGQADDAFIENIQKNGISSRILLKPWTTRQLLQAIESSYEY